MNMRSLIIGGDMRSRGQALGACGFRNRRHRLDLQQAIQCFLKKTVNLSIYFFNYYMRRVQHKQRFLGG